MKNIQPTQPTDLNLIACKLQVIAINDDLESMANFQWTLFTEDGTFINYGISECSGDDYLNWNGDNQYPYTFIANKKNLTIL